jgi:aromatic ring-opening dioxygenase LigB subunit
MPTIGKEGLSFVEQTTKAMEALEQELYVAKPDTIIVISPHGKGLPDAVCLNLNDRYVTNFAEFGDLVTKQTWRGDIVLADKIREDFKLKHLPLTLISESELDYGAAIPLHYLTRHLPDVRILPITTASALDIRTHYQLGKQLKDEIMGSMKRVAVIASADLSHRVGENSPAGFAPRGVAFDEKIRELIEKRKPLGILDIDAAWAEEAQACGGPVLGLLAGIMDDVRHEATVKSYEKPFGVGYLVASLRIG